MAKSSYLQDHRVICSIILHMVLLFFIVSVYFFPLNIPMDEPFMGERRGEEGRRVEGRGDEPKGLRKTQLLNILVGRPCKARSNLLTVQLRQKRRPKSIQWVPLNTMWKTEHVRVKVKSTSTACGSKLT